MHFAAKIVVPESVADPLDYYRANTIKTHALIETAIEAGVERFVFSSTAAVYGNPQRVPVDEAADTDPLSPYGASKLMFERILRDACHAHGLSYLILRYFNVAGADPHGRHGQPLEDPTHLISRAVQTALAGGVVTVFLDDYDTPDGTCVRDCIHVNDLATAHREGLAYLREGGESLLLNCGYGRGYSVLEVITAVKNVSGVDFAVARGPRRAGDPAMIVADPGKIRERLGWSPKFNDLDRVVASAARLAWPEANRAFSEAGSSSSV